MENDKEVIPKYDVDDVVVHCYKGGLRILKITRIDDITYHRHRYYYKVLHVVIPISYKSSLFTKGTTGNFSTGGSVTYNNSHKITEEEREKYMVYLL